MKKLIALLLALVMVLSLTACGGGRTEAPAKSPLKRTQLPLPKHPQLKASKKVPSSASPCPGWAPRTGKKLKKCSRLSWKQPASSP